MLAVFLGGCTQSFETSSQQNIVSIDQKTLGTPTLEVKYEAYNKAVLSWSYVSEAKSYLIYTSPSADESTDGTYLYTTADYSWTFDIPDSEPHYLYIVAYNNEDFRKSPHSLKMEVVRQPNQPKNLNKNLSSDCKSVTLSWTGCADADLYRIYQWDSTSDENTRTFVMETAQTSATVSNLTAGTSYNYTVAGYNKDTKEETDMSDFISVYAGPSKPTVTVSKITGSAVSLHIAAIDGCDKFEIKYQDGATDKTSETQAGDITVDNLTSKTSYTFNIRAFSSAANVWSADASVSAYTMPDIEGLKVTNVTKSEITVEWNDAGADYYLVRCKRRTAIDYDKTVVVKTNSATLSGLDSATDYIISAASYPNSSYSSYTKYGRLSEVDAMTSAGSVGAIIAVSNVTVEPIGTKLHLSWEQTSAANRYQIVTSTDSDYSAAVTVADTTDDNADLTADLNASHYYWVRAFKDSTLAGVSLMAGYIPPVQNVKTSVVYDKTLVFQWDTSTDFIAKCDSPQYYLYQTDSDGNITDATPLSTSTTSQIEYTPAKNSEQMYFKIRGLGNVWSEYSDLITVSSFASVNDLAISQIASRSIKLVWTAVTGATGYTLYYTGKADGKTYSADTGNVTDYTLTDLTDDEYDIYIVTTDGTLRSLASNIVNASLTLPAPDNFTAEVGDSQTQINVSWSAVAGAKGYKVYYIESTATGTISNVTSDTTSTVISGLKSRTRYYLEVAAFDYSDTPKEGEHSEGVICVTENITAPVITADSTTCSSIKITWSSVGTGYSYYVYFKKSADDDYECAEQTDSTSYTLSKLEQGTKYDIYVKSWKDGAFSKASNTLTVTTSSLNAPTDLSAVTGTNMGEIDVSFTKSESASKYYIYYSLIDDIAAAKNKTSLTTSTTLTGLMPDRLYYIWVKACSDGLYSEAVSTTATSQDLLSPQDMTVQTGDYYGQIKLSYTYNDSIDNTIIKYHTDDNTEDVIKDVISDKSCYKFTTEGSVKTITITLSGLVGGTKYYLSVHNYNSANNRLSDGAEATEVARGLSTPTATAATSTGVPHAVSYKISTADKDSGLMFEISRGTVNDIKEAVRPIQISANGGDLTGDDYSGLSAGVTYYYWIRSYLPSAGAYSEYVTGSAMASKGVLSTPSITAAKSTTIPHCIQTTITKSSDTFTGLKYYLYKNKTDDTETATLAGIYDEDEIGSKIDNYKDFDPDTQYYMYVRAYHLATDIYSDYASTNATTSIRGPYVLGTGTPGLFGTSGSIDFSIAEKSLSTNLEIRVVKKSEVTDIETFYPTVDNTTKITYQTASGGSYVYTGYGMSSNTVYYLFCRSYNATTDEWSWGPYYATGTTK